MKEEAKETNRLEIDTALEEPKEEPWGWRWAQPWKRGLLGRPATNSAAINSWP